MFDLKKTFALSIVGLGLLAGMSFLFLSESSSTTTVSSEFTPDEARAAMDLEVRPPAAPTSTGILGKAAEAVKGAVSGVVSKSTATAAEYSKFCTEGASAADFSCFDELYARIVKEAGIPTAFADLKERYEQSDYVQSQCHPLTHVIGRAAAQKFTEVSDAYKAGDSYCWSGYYHGVLETFIGRIGRANIPQKIDAVCKKLNEDGRYSFDYFNCVHGLGHGLMAITDNELYQSLKYCDSVTGDWEQQSCAGGVFMENVIVDGLNHTTKYLDPKRPQFPCDESPDKYKNTCYLMQTSYMLKINGGDFAQTFKWCRDAGAFMATCNQSLGRDASGRSVSDGPKTHAICMMGETKEEITNCVIGAVKDFVSYFHSDRQAKAFCELFVDQEVRSMCSQTVASYYTSF
jgi:hypothetical protein